MSRAVEHSGRVDLDALDAFLMSDRAPANSMGLPDLDGFITAVAIGPEMIVPSEWLPVVWGGERPDFVDLDEAVRMSVLMVARYKDIVSGLSFGLTDWAPVFSRGPADGVTVSNWAVGFLEAVAMRPDPWSPLFEDREAVLLMTPIVLAGGERGVAKALGIGSAEQSRGLNQAFERIPTAVRAIDAFWKQRRTPDRSGQRRSRTVH